MLCETGIPLLNEGHLKLRNSSSYTKVFWFSLYMFSKKKFFFSIWLKFCLFIEDLYRSTYFHKSESGLGINWKLDRWRRSNFCNITGRTMWPCSYSCFDFTHKYEKHTYSVTYKKFKTFQIFSIALQ